jgi:outer membrane protein assembly factor BamB
MAAPTLEDHLRKATRHGSARLPEDQVFALGRDLARELARAHAEQPPRHPSLDPAEVAMVDGAPRLDGGSAAGSVAEDLFRLGSLLHSLLGREPHVSWRLDGPAAPEVAGIRRRSVLATLASPSRMTAYASATEAMQALESVLAPAAAQVSWPCFRGGPARTGAAASALRPKVLASAWAARVGAVAASPALTSDLVLVPTAAGRLLFLDRGTGRLLHETAIGSAVESSPTVADGLILAGTDDGELVAVGLADGAIRHRVRLGSLVRSSPLAIDGRVVVGVVEGKTAGALTAVDLKTGKVAWSRRLGAVFSSPAAWGKRVLVGSDDGAVHAFDLGTGAPAWSVKLAAKVRATPAVVEGLAVLGDFTGRLAAVRVDDGSLAWTSDAGHAMYSSACPLEGRWVVGCHEGHLHGRGGADGAPVFEVSTHGPVIASATAVGDALLIGSTDGALYLVGADGEVRHRLPLARSGVSSSAAVDGDLAFVGSGEGVHAVRLAGGQAGG